MEVNVFWPQRFLGPDERYILSCIEVLSVFFSPIELQDLFMWHQE